MEQNLMRENERTLTIVTTLLERFHNAGINYCHWKSNQHFSDALAGIDDLDILIDRKQYATVVKILQELQYKHFYTPASRTYVGIEDYLGFDSQSGKLLHLHLHSRLIVGEKHLKGFHLPIEDAILSHRRYERELDVYMSSYSDELLLLILRVGMKIRRRDIFKVRQITGSTKNEFEWLKKNCGDFDDFLREARWLTDRTKAVVKTIYSGDVSWWKLELLKYYLYKDLSPYSLGSEFHNTLLRNCREAARALLEIKKRYLHTKYAFVRRRPATGGVTIAFLGSDGAGKSTAVKEIYQWLFEFMDVRSFYMGSGDGKSSILRAPLKLGLKLARRVGIAKNGNNFSDSSLTETQNKKLSPARKLWVYTLAKERIRKLKSANRCRIRGYIVLTDRYPQDEFPGLCDGPRLSRESGIASKKEAECFRLARLCPPDLAIKLIVPPEIAVRRKPSELDVETGRNMNKRIRAIRFSDHTQCVEVDSSLPMSEMILTIKRAIWQSIF